jgi:carboxypeptidase T
VQNDWVLEEVSLNDYLGQEIRLRFKLRADGNTNEDGFYFDDFQILYNLENTGSISEDLTLNWNLFPNPTSSSVSLDFEAIEPTGTVRVLDQQGKEIAVMTLNGQDHKVSLNTENFPAGVYFVVVNSATHHFGTKRLVVLK